MDSNLTITMSQDGNFQELIVPITTGVSLEVDLIEPKESSTRDTEGNKLAICLHPWSWLGGRKEDGVIGSLAKTLLERNYHVIRYNSRSVGKSTGSSSFTGFSEAGDLKALVQWALHRIGGVMTVVLIGYSHGALITSLHPVLPAPIKTSHVLISYPFSTRGWLTLFRSSHYQEQLEQLLKDERSNVLVVHGDKDEFTGSRSYQGWAERLEEAVQGGGRLHLVEIRNATHFWHGDSGLELRETLGRWLP